MKEIMMSSVFWIIALVFAILSIRSFRGKGLLLNNAYLYASPKERQCMDKGPYYRQSGVVFAFICFVFILNGFTMIWKTWILFAAIAILMMATVIYAIVSSIRISQNRSNR